MSVGRVLCFELVRGGVFRNHLKGGCLGVPGPARGWRAEMISLHVGDAVAIEKLGDAFCFDALRHGFQAEAIGEGLQGFDKQFRISVFL